LVHIEAKPEHFLHRVFSLSDHTQFSFVIPRTKRILDYVAPSAHLRNVATPIPRVTEPRTLTCFC
jgi:hypothetical protein